MSAEPPIHLPTEEVEVYEARPPVSPAAAGTLFGVDNPSEVVERATEAARALDGVIRGRGLFVNISGREHVKVEGWTLLGSMLGVFPVVVWTRELEDHAGWEARVEARTRAGEVVGAAEAECRKNEANWSRRDSYALRSMAQTRATSKALRAPLGFIVELAGYQATPAEEMPVVDGTTASEDKPPTQAQHAKLAILIRDSDADLERYPLPPDDVDNVHYEDWTHYCKHYINLNFGKHSRSQLTRKEMTKLIDDFEKARIPFA